MAKKLKYRIEEIVMAVNNPNQMGMAGMAMGTIISSQFQVSQKDGESWNPIATFGDEATAVEYIRRLTKPKTRNFDENGAEMI